MDNIFEYATKNKLRFGHGYVTAEDLWDLPLKSHKSNWQSLDDIAKQINKEIRKNEESFVDETMQSDKHFIIALEIVKHIIAIKKEEINQQLLEKSKAEEKQLLLKALESKNIEEVNSLTKEELQEKLKNL